MIKKIVSVLLVSLMIFTNYLPISAKDNFSSKQPNRIEKINIANNEYTYSFYFENNVSTVLVSDGVKTDVVIYDKLKNLITLNGKKFGEITNYDMSIGSNNLISLAAIQRCGFDQLTNLYDEAGNLAVYEGCSTVVYYKGSQASTGLAAAALYMMCEIAGLEQSYLLFIGQTLMPMYLLNNFTVARQQYRSKYTMFFPYNGTYKYKRIYNSVTIDNGTIWAARLSVWWF